MNRCASIVDPLLQPPPAFAPQIPGWIHIGEGAGARSCCYQSPGRTGCPWVGSWDCKFLNLPELIRRSTCSLWSPHPDTVPPSLLVSCAHRVCVGVYVGGQDRCYCYSIHRCGEIQAAECLFRPHG